MINIKIFEITTLPLYSIIDHDKEKAAQLIRLLFEALISQAHTSSPHENTAYEIVFCSDGESAIQKKIRIYVIMRGHGSIIDNIGQAITNRLHAQSFTLRELDSQEIQEYQDNVTNITHTEMCAVVKTEKLMTSPNSYTGYYYFSDLLACGENAVIDNFTGLFNMLLSTNNTYVAFQLIPTSFLPQEESALSELSVALGQLVRGYQSSLGHLMREDYAKVPAKVYDYYSARSGQPMFLYNIYAASAEGSSRMLANQIMTSLRSSANPIALSMVELSNQHTAAIRFEEMPWDTNYTLQQYYRDPTIWGGSIVTPTALSRLPYLVSSEEAVEFFRLPIDDGKIQGIKSNKVAINNEMLNEGVLAQDNILVGYLQNNPSMPIGVPPNDFTKHAAIVGTPGTGKTTFSINLLLQLYKKGIPFLIIEPTKTEYRALIDVVPDLQIFTPGNNEVSPYVINPFVPPKGVRIEQYIPSLTNAFKAAFSMPEPLDIIFSNAIRRCYTAYGWKNYSKYGDTDVQIFGLYEFILIFKEIVANSDYSREVKGNIQSAGVQRLMNLIYQNSNIYDSIHTISLDDILSKPTVLELNSIGNPDYRSLIMALLLINICVHTKHNQLGDGVLKNAIMIDEAHVLFGNKPANYNGHADAQNITIKALQDMVAEIRSYGTSIIVADQAPTKIGREIIANTDVKVVFRLVENDEKSAIADSTNMTENEKQHLSRLNTGEAFVFFGKLDSPQLVRTEDVRKKMGIRLAVSNEEISQRMEYWNDHRELLQPYFECAYSNVCDKQCDARIRADADYYASKILEVCRKSITDVTSLTRHAVSIPEILKNFDGLVIDEKIINCTKIQFLRKSQLETNHRINRKLAHQIVQQKG